MQFPGLDNLDKHFPWLSAAKASVLNLSRALITTSLFVTGSVLGARYLGLLEAAELATYDQLVQIRPDAGKDDRLLVVGITEEDLQTLREWPVSDRTLTTAIQTLARHEPSTIAIDIFRDFPYEPGNEALQIESQQHSNIFFICKISAVNDMGTPSPPWVTPEQVGFADLVIDPGGILRRSLLMSGTFEPEKPYPKQHLCNQPGQSLLSISLQVTLQYLATQGIEPSLTDDQQLMLGDTLIPQLGNNFGGYQNSDTGGYQIMLNYRSKQNGVLQVSLMDLINGEVPAAVIRDRIVFIGYTTPQAKDDFYTPYSPGKDDQQKMPGVVVHAQSASQLLSAVLDNRPLIWSWPLATEILWIFTWSVLGGLLAWYLRHPAIFALVILAGCGILYSVCFWIFVEGGWIPFIPSALTFIGAAVGIVSFDRFNNSAYGQQVYRRVKTFLRLDIDIDEEHVKQQVSEITDNDYFRNLQKTAETIRDDPDPNSNPVADLWPHEHVAQSWEARSNHPTDEVTQSLDGRLHHADKTLQHQEETAANDVQAPAQDFEEMPKISNGDVPNRTGTVPPELISQEQTSLVKNSRNVFSDNNEADDYEFQFLQRIAEEAALLQEEAQREQISPSREWRSPSQTISPVETHFKPFAIESTYCQYNDSSPLTQTYLSSLVNKLDTVKSGLEMSKY